MTGNRENGLDQRRPAENTDDAYATLIPDEALPSGDPRYVQLDAARGRINIGESLTRKIRSADKPAAERGENFARLLLTGHRGCGKTTELFRLRDLLSEAGFTVVYFDAATEFDLNKQDVSWWNVLLEMIWQLDTQLSGPPHSLSIPKRPKEDAAEWLARIVTTKQKRTELEASLETELGAEAGLPFFLKAKAVFKSLVKTGSSVVRKIEIEADRRPEVLVDALAEIIRAVNKVLYRKTGFGLVIIVDGLEKMPLREQGFGVTSHSALFINNGDKLKSPPCHLIYTLPLALLRQVNVSQDFPEKPHIMPMIHVRAENGEPDVNGIAVMRELLHKRVSSKLFEDGAEEMLALASGGHVRDFIHLTRAAAAFFGDSITRKDADAAINGLIDYYDDLYDASFQEALLEVKRRHVLPKGPHDADIIARLLVLPYLNDRSWYALHPCVLRGPRLGQGKTDPAGRAMNELGTQAKSGKQKPKKN